MKNLERFIILKICLMFFSAACVLLLPSICGADDSPHFMGKLALPRIGVQKTYFVVLEGMTVRFLVKAEDLNNDVLTYIDPPLPLGAVIDPVTRIFSWTPTEDQIASYALTFQVSDGDNVTEKSVDIHVIKKMPAVDLSMYMPPVTTQIGGACTA